MKKPLYFYMAAVSAGLMASCCPQKIVTGRSTVDSVATEIRVQYIEKLRDTTIYVTVPAEVKEAYIPADSSFLETSLAFSSAYVTPEGFLSHSLENKPGLFEVVVPVRDTETTVTGTSEKNRHSVLEVPVIVPYTRWEKFLFMSGLLFWGAVLTGAVLGLRKILR